MSQLEKIATFTNEYAEDHVRNIIIVCFQNANSEWDKTNSQEIGKFFGLLLYMSVVHVGDLDKLYSSASPYNGLWARSFTPTIRRAEGLMRFVQVTDTRNHDLADKLRSIRQLYDFVRHQCRTLYRPKQQVSLNERMVKSKGHFSYRRFCPANRFALVSSCSC
eukprot:scpid31185/ scgid8833/ 